MSRPQGRRPFFIDCRLCINRIDRCSLRRRDRHPIEATACSRRILHRTKVEVIADHYIYGCTSGGFTRRQGTIGGLRARYRCAVIGDTERAGNCHVPRCSRACQRVGDDLLISQHCARMEQVGRIYGRGTCQRL